MSRPRSELERAIGEQPEALRSVARLQLPDAVERLREAGMVRLVGTGTSQHAAELGSLMLERAGLRATATSAAAFVHGCPLCPDDLVVVLSHTGETTYARRAREKALAAGALALSVTAAGVGWPEAIETGGREVSETYTRSYTSALAVLARVASALGATGLDAAAVEATAESVARALDEQCPETALGSERAAVLIGSGPAAVTAREGALKLREAARVLAEGYESEYLLHGNAVPLGPGDLLLAIDGERDPDALTGHLAAAAEAEGMAVARLEQPSPADPLLAQIPLAVRLQALALDRAHAAKVDPDRVIVGAWADDRLWGPGA